MVVQLLTISLQGQIDIPFWQRLADLKLNKLKLSQDEINLKAWTSVGSHASPHPKIQLSHESFECHSLQTHVEGNVEGEDFQKLPLTKMQFEFCGSIKNVNTLEEFKKFDKRALINDKGELILEKMQNGSIYKDPSQLFSFYLLSFIDLKKHKYIYWFCFPTITDKTLRFVLPREPEKLDSLFSIPMQQSLFNQIRALGKFIQSHLFFIICVDEENSLTIHSLSKWEMLSEDEKDLAYFGFFDPSGNDTVPSSLLLNYLFFMKRFAKKNALMLKIVCLRSTLKESLVISVAFREDNHKELELETPISFVGWELNSEGKPGPKIVDLNAHLNPETIASNALDLNLKLMTWRQFPGLNLDKIRETKVLLYGAGTLGCAVARVLLGWGFKNIDFVDNGLVSHSNPVRQSLFTLADVGKPKAEIAAHQTKVISPGISSFGYDISIPMPGHFVAKDGELQLLQNLKQLIALSKRADAIFLLTDTRESRWLPTVMGSMFGKITLNAALGFDSYLVMRHGVSPFIAHKNPRLGCYFCNDVVAPQNSMLNRTLDQQCTVTRPGLAPISAGLAVEFLISILHHADQFDAPCSKSASNTSTTLIPHIIRGYLDTFETANVEAPAFPSCSACSTNILEPLQTIFEELEHCDDLSVFALKKQLLPFFNDEQHLEKLSGLAELKDVSEDVLLFSDSELSE